MLTLLLETAFHVTVAPMPSRRIDGVLRPCLVQIPAPTGGHHPYEVEADSSLKAAAIALRLHTKPVADEAVITVIPDGASSVVWNAPQINASRRSYRYRAARVRQWMRAAEWVWIVSLFRAAGISPIDVDLQNLSGGPMVSDDSQKLLP